MAYDAEEAARRAKEAADRAEQAAMLADLSEERRAQLAVPDAPPEHILAEDPRTQAQAKLIARGEKIRGEAETSKDPNAVKRAGWYPDVPVNEDGDRFSGQGHRDRQLAQQSGSFGRPGARPAQQGPQSSRSNLGGGGGPPQTRAAARGTILPASSRVQRPPSPRKFGTVRFPPPSRPILPATGAQRTSSNATTGPRQSAAMIAAQQMAFALGSNGTDQQARPAQAPLPAFRQANASNGPAPSTMQNNSPRTFTPTAPPAPKASTTTAPSTQAPANKGPASTTSSTTSGNGIVRVSANAIAAQNTLRLAGIPFIIEGSEDQAMPDRSSTEWPRQTPAAQSMPSFSSPSPQATPRPAQEPPRNSAPSPTRSQDPAPVTGASALISYLNPTGAAAKMLNSMGIISTEPRVLPSILTPPSFPNGGRTYPTSPQQSVFSYSRAASPASQTSSARPATMQPATQTNTSATGLGASRYANGDVPAVSSSSTINGHTAPSSAAASVAPHMAIHPNPSSSSIAPAPARRTRTAVPRGVALASASTATQPPAEDVVMGGTTAAPSTLAPTNSGFTFSMPTTGNASAPSIQQPPASSSTAAPTSATFVTPALPVTRRGVDASIPIHRMQARMYAGGLTPEENAQRVQYYERFPERLHFLEEARDQLIREGRPTYPDVMDTEPSKPVEKKETESSKKPDTKPVKQEKEQIATPVARFNTSRSSLAPHLRNGTASPAPHLRRAAAVTAPASSHAEAPAAVNTPQQAIKAETQDTPNVSRPRSEAPSSTRIVAPSSPSPAAQAHNTRAAAAIATANGANIAQGMLSVIFQDANGNFLGNRSIAVDAPVQANLNITSRHIEFNPIDLANEMAALAAAMRLHIDGVRLKRGDGGPWEEDKKKE
ncbi:hypothetical protein TI39_contig5823g00006 [Zymoseptoria brevis]|uniref:Uncharacterized protein n=1 Tax=Zymoseptoria brevis TaxID=1047168 RepID=A0A0F4G707_9PEZI|nr:hypothetical protein TI39_contig5823g00006 [Zymoseptoria brevis]